MRVARYALAGFMATILIAWAVNVFLPCDQRYTPSPRRNFGAHLRPAGAVVDESFRIDQFGRVVWQIHGPETMQHGWEEWVSNATWVGLPFPAFEASGVYDARTDRVVSSQFDRGIPFPSEWVGFLLRANVVYFHQLPLRPLPLGLLADTAFWALAAYGAVSLFRWRRAARRRRRGRCCACGYLVAGLLACPECGAALSEAPRPAP